MKTIGDAVMVVSPTIADGIAERTREMSETLGMLERRHQASATAIACYERGT